MADHTFVPPALPSVEERFASLDEFEIRSDKSGDGIVFEGHAAVFDAQSERMASMGGEQFVETIARGAFRKAIPSSDVRFLWNHQTNEPLARSSVKNGPGSLNLSEDTTGLLVRAQFANTTLARDLRELVHTRVVREMSFAWPRGAARDSWEEANVPKRTIHSFDSLKDVSLVSFPAYPDANDAVIRSLQYGNDVLDEDLHAVAQRIFRGEQTATDKERLMIDEAYARIDSLSPWMEERARRVLGTAASVADQGAEGTDQEPPVGDRVPVAARERRHRYLIQTIGEAP